jgi:hypothetical protein
LLIGFSSLKDFPMPAILEWSHTVVDADLDGLGHAKQYFVPEMDAVGRR